MALSTFAKVSAVKPSALLNESLIAFVDQIRCTRERLLDVAYHNRGTWEALPDGAKWSPPNKLGYNYLRNATVRDVEDGMALTVRVRDDLRTVITFATDPEAKLITATGVGAHVEDRVPIAFLRCRARQATFAWCISLNGKPARIEWLPVCGEDGNALPKAVAVAMRIVNADGQAWHIVANPDCQSITVQLTSGTKWHTERAFAVR
ncbi:MAG TPA: hypothetical protein EYP10_14165 [Armatimonadetes bacterium]|nr:hypothetical protein [Armatimonadota bacterium]